MYASNRLPMKSAEFKYLEITDYCLDARFQIFMDFKVVLLLSWPKEMKITENNFCRPMF